MCIGSVEPKDPYHGAGLSRVRGLIRGYLTLEPTDRALLQTTQLCPLDRAELHPAHSSLLLQSRISMSDRF